MSAKTTLRQILPLAVVVAVIGCTHEGAAPPGTADADAARDVGPDTSVATVDAATTADQLATEEMGGPPPDLAGDASTAPAPTCVLGVPRRFREIPDVVMPAQYLGANNPGVIPYPRYTTAVENLLGLGEHFQGVQRIGQTLILTGGVKNGPRMSQLIVIEMGTRSATAAWSLPTYGFDPAEPPAEDRVVSVVDIDATLWHAGGAQLTDGVLVVPIAGDAEGSEIRFFDAADPRAIVELPVQVRREGTTYAAAVARELDGTHLLVAWDDRVLDFFRSNTVDLADGFDPRPRSVDPADVTGGFQGGGCGLTGCGTYQSVNLVRDCDGRLFLVGTRNTQKGAPAVDGEDLASLYEVTFWADGSPHLTFVERRSFACPTDQCSFGAGAGIFVLDSTHLVIYAAAHWLRDAGTRYSFMEFAAP